MKSSDKRLQTVFDILLLMALFWFVRYWHSGHFGLYEDDLTIIPDAFQRSFSSLIEFIYSYIIHLYGHARPLSDSFIYLFSWLGWRIAGLWGPYLIGFAITAVNIGLFYWLIRRVSDRALALLSGLAFVLYAADTTQAFLTHSLGLQPSVLLILLAMHSYLSDWRVLSYGLAFIVLFGYELPFVLFAAVPLFKPTWNKRLFKELILHGLILSHYVGGYFCFPLLPWRKSRGGIDLETTGNHTFTAHDPGSAGQPGDLCLATYSGVAMPLMRKSPRGIWWYLLP